MAAVTVTNRGVPGAEVVVRGTIAFDSSYATGGEQFSVSDFGLTRLDQLFVFSHKGFLFEWDGSTTSPKVLAYRGDNANPSAAPAVQVTAGADLSSLTAVPFIAYGA